MGVWGVSHACMHAHAHAHMHAHACYRILSDSGGPPPLGGGRWVDGGGGRYGCVGGCPMHVCMHTHMHACTHMHVKHAKHGCLHAGGHLQFYTCVCACACVRVHVRACGDTPHAPRYPQRPPPPTCPLPRAPGSPKHQISITLELIKIIRFCLKILYL